MNVDQLDRALISGPHGNGFPHGFTTILNQDRDEFEMAMDFGIHRLAEGEVIKETHHQESTWVLLSGKACLEFSGRTELV